MAYGIYAVQTLEGLTFDKSQKVFSLRAAVAFQSRPLIT